MQCRLPITQTFYPTCNLEQRLKLPDVAANLEQRLKLLDVAGAYEAINIRWRYRLFLHDACDDKHQDRHSDTAQFRSKCITFIPGHGGGPTFYCDAGSRRVRRRAGPVTLRGRSPASVLAHGTNRARMPPMPARRSRASWDTNGTQLTMPFGSPVAVTSEPPPREACNAATRIMECPPGLSGRAQRGADQITWALDRLQPRNQASGHVRDDHRDEVPGLVQMGPLTRKRTST